MKGVTIDTTPSGFLVTRICSPALGEWKTVPASRSASAA
ncbi:hypothetical protein QFZ52_000982 [Arthrobacter woluwensis]|nr:hypothetical protein [Arthrobacter woluwensis]